MNLTLWQTKNRGNLTYADNFESGWISVYFYRHEPNEPPHVHIDKDVATAKVWLHDATVARSIGFSAQDLGKIQQMVRSHQSSLKEAWNAFFGT